MTEEPDDKLILVSKTSCWVETTNEEIELLIWAYGSLMTRTRLGDDDTIITEYLLEPWMEGRRADRRATQSKG